MRLRVRCLLGQPAAGASRVATGQRQVPAQALRQALPRPAVQPSPADHRRLGALWRPPCRPAQAAIGSRRLAGGGAASAGAGLCHRWDRCSADGPPAPASPVPSPQHAAPHPPCCCTPSPVPAPPTCATTADDQLERLEQLIAGGSRLGLAMEQVEILKANLEASGALAPLRCGGSAWQWRPGGAANP